MYPDFILHYLYNGKTSRALRCLLTYLETSDPFDEYAYCDIGYCYIRFDNYDKAILYLKIGYDISKNKNNIEVNAIICINLASAYKLKGNAYKNNTILSKQYYNKAKNYLDEYFKLIKNINDTNYQQAKSLDEELKRKLQLINT